MIYHPDFAKEGGSRRRAAQTTDPMPTFLDMAGLAIPDDVTGHSQSRCYEVMMVGVTV